MNETTGNTAFAAEPPRTCAGCGSVVAPEASEGLCTRCLLAAASVPTDGPGAGAPGPRPRGAPPELPRVRAAFPRLEVIELIGVGGMGAVFKARQPDLERWVALKVLPEDLGRDPAFAERFLREARVLARLTHPNIVAVHDFGQSDGLCYVLMEYVDGVNLRQAMRAGRFTPAQALGLVPQLCAALQFAHDAGVMHRDVKPENILLDARGQVKLADFGIAKLLDAGAADPGLTVTGASVGTPQYMAPEQIEHPGAVDHRADIYSLGVVFYELLTGELPLGRFSPPSAKTPLDARVDEIVMRALAKERELRQQSAAELRTEVERVGGNAEPAARTGGGGAIAETAAFDAPLWKEPVRTRQALLVLVAASAGVTAWNLCLWLKFQAKQEWDALLGDGPAFLPHLAAYALVALSIGVVWSKRKWWLEPLRQGPAEEDRLGQALVIVARLLAAMWFGAVVLMYLPSWTGLVRLLLAPNGGGGRAGGVLLYFVYVVGLPLVLGWAVTRSMKQPSPGPLEPMPRAALRVTYGLVLASGASSLLTWLVREDASPTVIMSLDDFLLPVWLAIWFRSPFWRVVGLAGTGYCLVGTLAGTGLMAVDLFFAADVHLGPSEMVSPASEARPERFVGSVAWSVLLVAVFGLLRSEGVRRAFGRNPGPGPTRPASVP